MSCKSYHDCECGQPSTIYDSTGWHCADCERFVRKIVGLIGALIQAQRRETNFDPTRAKRLAYYNGWKAKNREKFLTYQRNYHRKAA